MLFPLGAENKKHITPQDYWNAIRAGRDAVLALVKLVRKNPENRNLRVVKNKKGVYTLEALGHNNKWVKIKKEDLYRHLYWGYYLLLEFTWDDAVAGEYDFVTADEIRSLRQVFHSIESDFESGSPWYDSTYNKIFEYLIEDQNEQQEPTDCD